MSLKDLVVYKVFIVFIYKLYAHILCVFNIWTTQFNVVYPWRWSGTWPKHVGLINLLLKFFLIVIVHQVGFNFILYKMHGEYNIKYKVCNFA
jgi:hypothetical protein